MTPTKYQPVSWTGCAGEAPCISLQKLGALSGVSRVEMGLIEKGERNPSQIICLRVADALGLNLGNVLNTVIAQSRRK
jgi:DNA-binding XRE family transcriptional regulator